MRQRAGALGLGTTGGAKISLAVIRHLVSHPQQRIGSLFVNPGGPGDSGVAMVAERGEALDALGRGRFDIVGWDIRGGAGASAPVSCFADAAERASFWEGLPVPTTRAEERRYLAKTIELTQRCGDRQLTYFGESFGTLIGQTYANLFPHRAGPWRWTAWSTLSPPPPAPRRFWPAPWPTSTGCSGSSCGCARRPPPTGARWPATARSPRASTGCSVGCAMLRSRRPRPPRLGS